MEILTTIIPVFIVIFIGLFARQKGFLQPEFINPANRLVYYFAIPAMVFSAIAKIDLKTQMNMTVILISMGMVLLAAGIAWFVRQMASIRVTSMGSFIQCSFHGNLGYIGFAIVFYYLGEEGLAKGAIIASFVMILQNILAILLLQYYSKDAGPVSFFKAIKKAVGNPVILSAVAGIAFSFLNLELPIVIDRALTIIKGMALPLALLIIGATLSFEQFASRIRPLIISSLLKLVLMPGAALVCFSQFEMAQNEYIPALIILAAPTATMTYVMAKEIGGDPDLGGAAISFSTLISALTYMFWLSVV